MHWTGTCSTINSILQFNVLLQAVCLCSLGLAVWWCCVFRVVFFVTQIVGRRHLFKGKQERERRRVAQKAATKEPAEISSVLVPRKQGNEIEVKENLNVCPTLLSLKLISCYVLKIIYLSLSNTFWDLLLRENCDSVVTYWWGT